MFKTIVLIVFLSLGVAFNSYADDSNRIDQLEKEVQWLKLRISKLESLLTEPTVAQEVVKTNDGGKSITNWRELTTSMGPDEVEIILGAPQRVDGGNTAFWHYQNGGQVTFMSGKVFAWSEPRE